MAVNPVVYLVYEIYQYDGLDNISVYNSRTKAVSAATNVVARLLLKNYRFADGSESFTSFNDGMASDSATVTLESEDGEVRIEIERKIVQ